MLELYMAHLNKLKIVLASNSPRRIELLKNIGLNFEALPHLSDEELIPEDFDTHSEFVMETAKQKALSLFHSMKYELNKEMPNLFIGADTVVSASNNVYGKPINEEDAYEMLKSFSGTSHSVITGVSLLIPKRIVGGWEYDAETFHEETIVTMPELSELEIKSYISTGESMDKAGGYAIQGKGSTYIKGINGDYFNVVGFPLHRFANELLKLIKSSKLLLLK